VALENSVKKTGAKALLSLGMGYPSKREIDFAGEFASRKWRQYPYEKGRVAPVGLCPSDGLTGKSRIMQSSKLVNIAKLWNYSRKRKWQIMQLFESNDWHLK
jgi:hypothetical protein